MADNKTSPERTPVKETCS